MEEHRPVASAAQAERPAILGFMAGMIGGNELDGCWRRDFTTHTSLPLVCKLALSNMNS